MKPAAGRNSMKVLLIVTAVLEGATGVVAAMLLYNVAIVAVLLHASIGLGFLKAGPWPAAGLHTALALWCVASLRQPPPLDGATR